MRIYFDASALAKRYLQEPGTPAVLKRCGQASEILVSALAIAELLSGMCRLLRDGRITTDQYATLKTGLLADMDQASIIDLTPVVLRDAVRCLETSPLKTIDAIHVASAVASGCDLFVSADHQQCAAARKVGLRVEQIL